MEFVFVATGPQGSPNSSLYLSTKFSGLLKNYSHKVVQQIHVFERRPKLLLHRELANHTRVAAVELDQETAWDNKVSTGGD